VTQEHAWRADSSDAPTLSSWARRSPVVAWIIWFAVVTGFALRILHYLANRSLSIDESFLALNVIEKRPGQLLHALAFKQAAPLGFLEAQKLMIIVFGRSEHSLRLLPLVASLVALLLFVRVARGILEPPAATLAVAVFALLDPLVYYSATAKQYAFDVLGTVLVLLAALAFEARPLKRVELVLLAPLGAILVWFSHAAAFELVGLGSLLTSVAYARRDRRALARLGVVFAVWIGSFTVEYELTRSNLGRILGAFHGSGTVFAQAGGGGRLAHVLDRLRYITGLEDTASGKPVLGFLPEAVNRGLTLVIVIVGLLGFISLFRRRARIWLVLTAPPVIAVVVSAFQKYPLAGRTVLFVLPAVALCLGEGSRVLAGWRSRFARPTAVVGLVSLATIAVLPLVHAVRPRTDEEMRPALAYLGRHHRPEDTLLVSSSAQYAFAYYHLCGCSTFDAASAWALSTTTDAGATAVISRTPNLVVQAGDETSNVRTLLGRKRVWALFAEDDRGPLLDYLTAHGSLLETYRTGGPSAITATLQLYGLAR